MVNITPEEKEKIIQLFETQEVDNLLLVYSLLEGFGLNILDCDWLIKDYLINKLVAFCNKPLFLPIDLENQMSMFKLYANVDNTWNYCFKVYTTDFNKKVICKHLEFKIDMYDSKNYQYLQFVSLINK